MTADPAALDPTVTLTGQADEGGGHAAESPRIVELLALAEQQPTGALLEPYLIDTDPQVRRTAIATLTETTPDGFGLALVRALHDSDADVRIAAGTGLRELVEVLTADQQLAAHLRTALRSSDAHVRATVVDLLRALRLGDPAVFQAALADQDPQVRLQAVRGLVSVDAADLIAAAAGDPVREVRVAVATGLGAAGDPQSTAVLTELAEDTDMIGSGNRRQSRPSPGRPQGCSGLTVQVGR